MNAAPIEASSGGYRIKDSGIHLDPLEPVACAIISHAHGDHAVPGHETVYCSEGTAAILNKRFTYIARNVNVIKFGEKFTAGGMEFSLHPAGHILGSSQIRWINDNKVIVYTGDYKREEDPTCEPFEVLPCDILITEVTFGQKDKVHPPSGEVINMLSRFGGINLLIGAYAVGKAQRITRLINDYLPGKRVMVHPKIVPYHKVYESLGFGLGKWEPYRREEFKRSKDIAYIVPPPVLLNFSRGKHYLKALATGWDEKHGRYDLPLPVSDHADWPSLLQTIKETSAREVFMIHGEGIDLGRELESSISINQI